MGAFGQIGYSQPNVMSQPSGAVWGDCPSSDLLMGDQGYLAFKDWIERVPAAADGASVAWATGTGATFTYRSSAQYDHVLSLTSGSSAIGNDTAVASRPLGPIVPGGGGKVWFEAIVATPSISASKGVFVGLVNGSALGAGLLLNGSSTYATAANNLIGTSTGNQSGYGFWLHGDALTNFDAVWFNSLQSATSITSMHTGAANYGTVLLSVLTAPANNPNPANLSFVPQTPPGVLVAELVANSGGLTPQQILDVQTPATNPQTFLPNNVTGATGFVKLGIRYDGQQFLYFYVNGNQVAKMAITSAQDVVSSFAGVVEIAAGAAANTVLDCGFSHAAAKKF